MLLPAITFVAAVLIGLVLYRSQQRLAGSKRLVAMIERMRATAADVPRRRPASVDHPLLRRQAPRFEALSREVESAGGAILGDIEELNPDGSSVGVARWFLDASRTACGWFSILERTQGPLPVLLIMSELVPTQYVSTQRGGASSALAPAPTVHRGYVDATIPISLVLEQHRLRVRALAPALPSRVEDLAGAQALVDRLRAHLKGWREAQDPAALLVLDLKSTLQDRYDELGPGVQKLMRLPRSTPA